MEYRQKKNDSMHKTAPHSSRPQKRGKDASKERHPRHEDYDDESKERRPRTTTRKENEQKKPWGKPWKQDEEEKPKRTSNKRPAKRSFDKQAHDNEYERNQQAYEEREDRGGKAFSPKRRNTFSRNDDRRDDKRRAKRDAFKHHFDDAGQGYRSPRYGQSINNQGRTASSKKDEGLTRLNKYIANAGICSRREADELIAAGSVTVNGVVITEMGYKVAPGDVVSYGGETLRSERKRYFLLNKPKGFITTVDDPQERQTVMMLMDGACNERIYPVGRLDRATTGLLLFTNDGELAKKLTHPSTRVYKIYHVELDKPVTRNDMQQMLDGIELEDGMIQVDDVQYVEGMNDRRAVGIVLHSGRNRIVRRIFEHLGYNVHKLDRVVFAGLTKKDLPRGRYRELTDKEVGFLKMI